MQFIIWKSPSNTCWLHITVLFVMWSLHSWVVSHTQVNGYKHMSWTQVLFVKQAIKSETVDGVTRRILSHFIICFISMCKLDNLISPAPNSRPIINDIVCNAAEVYKDQVPSNSISSVICGDNVCKCSPEKGGRGGRNYWNSHWTKYTIKLWYNRTICSTMIVVLTFPSVNYIVV